MDNISKTRKTKIIYIIGSLNLGGAEKQLVELIIHMDKEKYELRVCSLAWGGPLEKVLENAGVKVKIAGAISSKIRIPIVCQFGTLFHYMKGFLRLCFYIRREKPDIVHGYLPGGFVYGCIAAKLAGIPVFIASKRSLGYYKRNRPIWSFLENQVNWIAKAVIVNSSGVKKDVLQNEKINPEKIRLVYNGIDASKYGIARSTRLEKEFNIKPGDRVITTVANFIHYKGHLELISAAKGILSKFKNVRFLLVGKGPMEMEVRERVKELLMEKNIIFAGSREDIPEILSITDVLVHPSHEEGFSNVILEGMAAGKPVIATNVGGNPEAVIDGETGIIIPPRDASAISNAITKLLREKELSIQMGRKGLERVRQEFSMDTLVKKMEGIYSKY